MFVMEARGRGWLGVSCRVVRARTEVTVIGRLETLGMSHLVDAVAKAPRGLPIIIDFSGCEASTAAETTTLIVAAAAAAPADQPVALVGPLLAGAVSRLPRRRGPTVWFRGKAGARRWLTRPD